MLEPAGKIIWPWVAELTRELRAVPDGVSLDRSGSIIRPPRIVDESACVMTRNFPFRPRVRRSIAIQRVFRVVRNEPGFAAKAHQQADCNGDQGSEGQILSAKPVGADDHRGEGMSSPAVRGKDRLKPRRLVRRIEHEASGDSDRRSRGARSIIGERPLPLNPLGEIRGEAYLPWDGPRKIERKWLLPFNRSRWIEREMVFPFDPGRRIGRERGIPFNGVGQRRAGPRPQPARSAAPGARGVEPAR